jgi:hypothetical protein
MNATGMGSAKVNVEIEKAEGNIQPPPNAQTTAQKQAMGG